MTKKLKTLSLFLLLLTAPLQIYSYEDKFERWLVKTTEKLNEKGKVVHTALGDVQVVIKGKGPVVVALHGGFGGWDQGELVASNIQKQGFQVIIPSRVGYLATPIATNPLLLEETTPAQQADQLVALLDALEIPKVIVLGFSAGAPVAYEFGLRHPDRTNAVVLECIGANPDEDGFFYAALGAILASETESVDYTTYLLHISLKKDYYSAAVEFLPADTSLTGSALEDRNHYVLHHLSQYNFLREMLKATIPISPRLLGTLNDFIGVPYWTDTYTPPTPVQYSLPTLIIQAINDSNGYYPTAQSVHAGLPTSQLISVKESGHFIWLGPNTKKWEKQLFDFLKAHGH
ncbi:MAG: alpha/beta hydrolase [Parachlamydiaceae bacterium]|nr:alpha/beta hydrolase [Parachlamydiaceae bacterium]